MLVLCKDNLAIYSCINHIKDHPIVLEVLFDQNYYCYNQEADIVDDFRLVVVPNPVKDSLVVRNGATEENIIRIAVNDYIVQRIKRNPAKEEGLALRAVVSSGIV